MTSITLLPGVIGEAPKAFRTGTHRAAPLEETLDRLRPLLPLMGITRIANVTGLDAIGVPVVMACRPNSRSLSVTQGKGLSLVAAKASAAMEAAEGFHAERIAKPLLLGSYEALRTTHRLVDVMRLPQPKTGAFHPHLPILWIEGFDLLQQAPTWVPYELVHLDFTLAHLRQAGTVFGTTGTGLASGNHPLEALSHAICEAVERDATVLWRLGEQRNEQQARLDLATVDDPSCLEVLAAYERAGLAVAVWETTTDIGLPAFRCLIAERAPDRPQRLPAAGGAGCHPTRHVALLRALTEAAQSRLTMIAGSRDDLTREEYEHLRDPDTLERAADVASATVAPRRFGDAPSWEGDSFAEDVTWELMRLQAVGISQVVAIDLSLPQIGLPVQRVVIPGLEDEGRRPISRLGPRGMALRLDEA